MIDAKGERSPNVTADTVIVFTGNAPHEPTIVSLEGGVRRQIVAPDETAPPVKPKRPYKRRAKEESSDA